MSSPLAALRAPFPPEVVEQRPVVTCRACLNSNCVDHQVKKCRTCKEIVSQQHVHLPYLGHAIITERLNEVTPEWWWEPYAHDSQGLPAFTSTGGLWIKLFIPLVEEAGGRVTWKPGFGTADTGSPDNGKEVIGDALRNAAMRFGIGLELWKGPKVDRTVRPGRPGLPANPPHPLAGLLAAITSASARRGRVSNRHIVDHFEAWARGEFGSAAAPPIGDADADALERYLSALLAEAVPA